MAEKIKQKDPAFLFYSKDWIVDTFEMNESHRGIYIDMLAYQHIEGSLPVEHENLAKICRLSYARFEELWPDIMHKFIEVDGRLYNKRLSTVLSERSAHAKQNRIVGIFSQLIRKLDVDAPTKNEIRKKFKTEQFLEVRDDLLSEVLSNWLSNCLAGRLAFLGNANGNINNTGGSAEGGEEIIPKPYEQPTLAQVKIVFLAQGLPETEAENFWSYYEKIGWKTARGQPIKYWTAGIIGWINNSKQINQGKTNGRTGNQQRSKDYVSREEYEHEVNEMFPQKIRSPDT